MTKWFARFWLFYNNENVPNVIANVMAKYVQNFAKYYLQKAQNLLQETYFFEKLAQFRQIWSHCHSRQCSNLNMELLSLLVQDDFVIPDTSLIHQLRQVLVNVPDQNLCSQVYESDCFNGHFTRFILLK